MQTHTNSINETPDSLARTEFPDGLSYYQMFHEI